MQFISSTAPLGAAGVYNSGWVSTIGVTTILGDAWADQPGTVYIEQSPDATNPDISVNYPVVASTGKIINETLELAWVRIRYVNGATPQTAFRLEARGRNTEYS